MIDKSRHGAITLEVLPEPSYVELSDRGQHLNCDLLVTNTSSRSWTLTRLQVSVLDRSGALGWRRFLDDNGIAPGIAIVPNRQLEPESTQLVFNPIPSFPSDLDLTRVRFELTYEQVGGGDQLISVDIEPVAYTGATPLRLPLDGRFIVWDGHDLGSHHRRWDYRAEPLRSLGFDRNAFRYAYDLITVDDHGDMVHGDPDRNDSWIGFGRSVLAPGAGTVVAVVDDRPDDRLMDLDAVRQNLLAVFGNYVVLDHANGEFSVLAHLKHSSAEVSVGGMVVAGQPLAAVGASGSSLMPHLHYQLQTSGSGRADGLPSYFADFIRVRGSTRVPVARGQIDSGEIIEAAAGSP